MPRPLDPAIINAKNALTVDPDKPLLFLLKLQLNAGEYAYMNSGNELISAFDPGDGTGIQDWPAFPFVVGDQTEDAGGTPSSLQIATTNIGNIMSAIIEQNRGFPNKKVTLYLFKSDGVGGGDVLSFGSFRVSSAGYTREKAALTVGNQDVYASLIPRRTYQRDFCEHAYKGQMCAYVGPLLTCNHKYLSAGGCSGHDNKPNYGGKPGILKRQ